MKPARVLVAVGIPLAFAGAVTAPAFADLVSASTAYQKGDYARALQDFRELAELGQPTAQYDLAVMYANGQGTRQSDIYAYAWASLAAENGLEKAKTLADALRPNLAPGSEKIAADIQAQFGNAVLDARLNPKIVQTAENEDRARCSPLHAYVPPYPDDARMRGVQGQVYVEFSVKADGRSRNPRIILAVPEGTFEPTVRDALLHSEFGAAPADQPPIQCTIVLPLRHSGCCWLLQVRRVRRRDPGARQSRRSAGADALRHAPGRIAPAQQAAQPGAAMVSQVSPGGHAGGTVPGGL